jgi:hypothetical protein
MVWIICFGRRFVSIAAEAFAKLKILCVNSAGNSFWTAQAATTAGAAAGMQVDSRYWKAAVPTVTAVKFISTE